MDNNTDINIYLKSNSTSIYNLKLPFLISFGVFILGLGAIIILFKIIHQQPDSTIVLGLLFLVVIIFLILKNKYIYDLNLNFG